MRYQHSESVAHKTHRQRTRRSGPRAIPRNPFSCIFAPIAALVIWACALPSSAQEPARLEHPTSSSAPAGPQLRPLSNSEIKARYRNCSTGYYSGPQPGKSLYTKDNFTWVVTPAFAAEFCMPPQFVSNELRGVEAIAYKMQDNPDEERCARSEQIDTCIRGSEHHFEIYYKSGAIPKLRPGRYQHIAHLPSAMLITENLDVSTKKIRETRANPVPGAMSLFATTQFGLQSVQNGKIEWPLGSLYSKIYYEGAIGQMDYLLLEGAAGFSRLEGWKRSGAQKFVITSRRVPDPKSDKIDAKLALEDYALIIELPQSLVDKIISNDRARQK